MTSTVTVRVSIVIGLILLILGTGIFGYSAYETANNSCVNKSGFDIERSEQVGENVTNFSELPREQRALILLAFEEENKSSSFSTTDDTLQSVIGDLPPKVKYQGTIYTVTPTVTDCASANIFLDLSGIFVTAVGALTLLGVGLKDTVHRFTR